MRSRSASETYCTLQTARGCVILRVSSVVSLVCLRGPGVEIWPAIDLRGGKCVRLRQGDYAQETVFGDDPTVPDGIDQLVLRDEFAAVFRQYSNDIEDLRLERPRSVGPDDLDALQPPQAGGEAHLQIGQRRGCRRQHAPRELRGCAEAEYRPDQRG